VEISAELDSSTNNIVFRQTLGGVKMPFEGALDYDSYLGRSIQYADQTSWRKSVMTKFPTKGETEGGGISISIPVFKSKQAQRIFGGSDIGLSVAGNIKVEGGLRLEKREELQQNNPNPTSYQFKVNQSQQFIIKGKVGEKVSVEIDQDSERLFDFENNLKLRYQGGDNEIVKSVEAAMSRCRSGEPAWSRSPPSTKDFSVSRPSRALGD